MKREQHNEPTQEFSTTFKRTWSDLTHGRIFSNDFFITHWKQIIVIIFCLLVYINNRYNCQRKLSEINQLQRELTAKKYDALTRSSQLMKVSRLSEVEQKVKERGLDLEISPSPPYKLKD